MMTVGSLFSGIGGFELGLERTGGFKTAWQCEKDEFCLKVLEKHWPDVKRFTDIHEMKEDIPYVDVICGGFPCQPVSCAGKRKGKEDERWLWPEFYRIVCEVKPRWVLVENVPGLLSADSGRLFAGILRDLASSGYDAEWNIVSAASVGAPHLRKRVFVVAHATSQQNDTKHIEPRRSDEQFGRVLADGREALRQENGQAGHDMLGGCCQDVANSDCPGNRREDRDSVHQGRSTGKSRRTGLSEAAGRQDGFAISDLGATGAIFADSKGIRCSGGQMLSEAARKRWGIRAKGDNPWSTEPDVGRVANGVPGRVDRLRALGNAIVPQCAEYVGRCVLEAEARP